MPRVHSLPTMLCACAFLACALPTGRINLDAGSLYPELLAGKQPPEVSSLWAKARMRHKFDAGIAHEHEEAHLREHPPRAPAGHEGLRDEAPACRDGEA